MGQNRAVASAAGVPRGGLEGFFRLREHGTDVRTEVLAGLTTFVVMSYIIAVNPAVLAAAGLDVRAVATSTCLVAGLLSIAMGLYTNRAFALAPGLGLNAIVAYSLVGTMGLTPAEAMGVVVAEGLLITVLVLLGVRKYVMDVVPAALSRAIAVGIGFFILFIGLRNAGVITFIPGQTGTVDGLLTLTPLNSWPIFVAMVGLLITIVLVARRFPAAILAGIVISHGHRLSCAGRRCPTTGRTAGRARLLADRPVQLRLLRQAGASHGGADRSFSFMLSDFFDTMGTLIGVGSEAGYLNDKGELVDAQRPLLVDSLGAVAGGLVSASSATTYIESAAGVAAGGRTGLVSVVTGVLFLLALPFVSLVGAIPAVATAPALIVVGVLMVGVLSEGAAGRRGDNRLSEPGGCRTGGPDDAGDAAHLQHHQRYRRRLRQLCADQAGERQGTGGPSGTLCHRRGLPDLLPALGAVRRPSNSGVKSRLPENDTCLDFDWSTANKALIREFFEQVWNQGHEEAIDRFIAENAGGNDPDFGMGREGFKKQWRKWRDAFPDIHFEIEEIIAEGDTVVARWTLTGTQTGPFLGIAPTGRKIRVGGMSMDHLRDGVLVSGFDGWDNLGLRQQLGAIPDDATE